MEGLLNKASEEDVHHPSSFSSTESGNVTVGANIDSCSHVHCQVIILKTVKIQSWNLSVLIWLKVNVQMEEG